MKMKERDDFAENLLKQNSGQKLRGCEIQKNWWGELMHDQEELLRDLRKRSRKGWVISGNNQGEGDEWSVATTALSEKEKLSAKEKIRVGQKGVDEIINPIKP
jgi:hypothetical protein